MPVLEHEVWRAIVSTTTPGLASDAILSAELAPKVEPSAVMVNAPPTDSVKLVAEAVDEITAMDGRAPVTSQEYLLLSACALLPASALCPRYCSVNDVSLGLQDVAAVESAAGS